MENRTKNFKSALLLKSDTIAHGFFGRKGGVSKGIYDSLNCGYGSNDSYENIKQNRNLVAITLCNNPLNINNPYQIHSNIAVIIDKDFPESAPQADAVITKTKGLIIGILTADCAPILFSDPINGIIAAAHSGWKGAIGGIIQSTIAKMIELGSEPANITAAIGPCIEQKSYEVGTEFAEEFAKQNPDNIKFFKSGKVGKFHFDLKGYCAAVLAASGIKNIDIMPNDTCAEEDDFFSNRRRNHRGEPDYGRNVSVIMLK